MDMVHETTQRISALPITPPALAVFNVAKEKGLSKILSAGNAVVSQIAGKSSRTSKAGAWLSLGTAAAGTLLQAAHKRGLDSWMLSCRIVIKFSVLLYSIFSSPEVDFSRSF